MSSVSFDKGKAFETEVGKLLKPLESRYPNRVKVATQVEVPLNDGRNKTLDFTIDYRLASSNHKVAVECQDRESWSTRILDKILVIRNNSPRNRFWFVYREAAFLTDKARKLLDKHGILHFSLGQLRQHIAAIEDDVLAAEMLESLRGMLPGGGKLCPPERLREHVAKVAKLVGWSEEDFWQRAFAKLKYETQLDEVAKLKYEAPSDQAMLSSPPPGWRR